MKKKKLLIMTIKPTSQLYKLVSFLRLHLEITIVFLSGERFMKEYKDLGIKTSCAHLIGKGFLKDKKIFLLFMNMLNFFFKTLKMKKEAYDYVFAGIGHDYIGYYLFKIFKKSKKIYFPYDIQLFVIGINKEKRPIFGIRTEKYCLENADFIFHKGPKNELNLIKKEEAKVKGKSIQFLPYCLDNWIMPIKKEKSKLKGLHLVHIGSGAKDTCFYLRIKPKDIFRLITKQEINIHLYSFCAIDKIPSKYMHIHEIIPNLKLNKVMGKYHYGFILAFHKEDGYLDKRFLKTVTANKLFSYLEAGIPVLINDEIEFMVSIIKKYKCGVVISEKDLPNLKKILKKQNYSKLLEGVKKAREDLKLSNHSERIINELGLKK